MIWPIIQVFFFLLSCVHYYFNRKLLGEYIDKEAELSGSEGGASDEDLDFGEEGDLLELEQGDMEDVGTDEQLRSQVAKVNTREDLLLYGMP